MKINNYLVKNFLLFGGLLFSQITFSENYVIDTKNAHASIIFSIKHLNYSLLVGRFDSFTGNFSYNTKNIGASKVNITVETSSVNTNNIDRDAHLRNSDFLNTGRFPLASFVSEKIVIKEQDNFDVIGDLTLNGSTKSITISAKKVGEGKDPWGGYRAGFEGTVELKLKDFNINFLLGPGSETLKLTLNIEGIKQ